MAGKQEVADTENKRKAQLQEASAAADAGELPARPVQQTIEGSFSRANKDELHALVADFFYGCGIPLWQITNDNDNDNE